MKPDEQSANILVPSELGETALIQAGKVALTFLDRTGQANRNQAVQIFWHMAVAAIERGREHTNIDYETPSLKEIVAPKSIKGASAWMSPLWKQLEDLQQGWGPGLEATAIELGYRFIPRLRKLQGSPVRYQLIAEPMEAAASEAHQAPVPDGGIRYTPAAVAAPGALLLAGLRGGIVRATLPFIISAVAIVVAVLLLLTLSGWWIVVTGLRWNSPLTTAHLSIVGMWGFAMWTGISLFRFFDQLADLGIVMAPEFLVPFKEDHVTLELRPREGNTKGAFAFVRYAATCPACSGRVLLHDGGEEFKGRIVGRCASSPREHVFSFDQKLHIGRPLRG